MHKKIAGLCTMILLSSAAYASSDTAGSATDVKTDQSTMDADQKILNSAHNTIETKYRKYNVVVSVHQGNVTLKGYVDDESTIKAIEAEVKKIKGVKGINNMLKVKPIPQGK